MIKVTIGMPTFNRANFLKRSIEQVLSQTFSDFEFIIYNDGSTDETVEILKSFTDKRITFINESNKGLPHPLNKVLDLAQGEYIIILHDHDIFNPKLIEKSVQALDEHPEAAFVFQGSAWINSDNTSGYQEFLLDLPLLNNGRKFGEQLLLKEHEFSSPLHACCMVRKSAYEEVGKYYDEKYGWYCDLDLWLRLLIKFDFIYLKEVLFIFTEREKNHLLSKKSWIVNEWMYQTHKKHLTLYFTDNISLGTAEKILIDKMYRTGFRTFIHSLVSGDKEYLNNSISEFSRYSSDNKIKPIVLKLLSSNISQVIVLKIGILLNNLRKKVKTI
jgi:glycosyltransferase involved in cell wall biosynthesis